MSASIRSRIRPWLMPAVACASVAAAGLYSLLPFSYAYFENTPYFRYLPGRVGLYMRRTSLAGLYERAWAIQPQQPFVEGDITCQFLPPASTPGCAHPLQPGFFTSGPGRTLPKGTYKATVQLDAPKACSGIVRLDVISTDFDMVLAKTEIRMGSAPSKSAQITFVIDRVLADRAKIDIRLIQPDGPACAVLKHVDLVRQFL